MPCYHPQTGYRAQRVNPKTGKRSIVFSKNEGFVDLPVIVPCGQCIGCRLERSRQWAIRCVHEAQMYENNCFITLTYAPQYLPKNGTLVKQHYQKFMKRLRKKFGDGIRYFACGEYGEKGDRPHYHAILFNFDFHDRILYKVQNGYKYYTSESLQKLWKYGFVVVGDMTFESAAYVARYVTKKVNGAKALEHYTKIDLQTGEVLSERIPEFILPSRKPGIGKPWLEKFSTDVYPDDFVVIREKKMKPPKYYDAQFDIANPEQFGKIKARRKHKALKLGENNTPERRCVREQIQVLKAKQLLRRYENGTEGV